MGLSSKVGSGPQLETSRVTASRGAASSTLISTPAVRAPTTPRHARRFVEMQPDQCGFYIDLLTDRPAAPGTQRWGIWEATSLA